MSATATAPAVRERPIPFSRENIPPIMAGSKTKTRRVKWNDDTRVPTVARHGSAGFLSGKTLLKWYHKAEHQAELPRIAGGAFYLDRRAGVDSAKARGASREGLQRVGGWTSTQVPDAVYADQDAEEARAEAATLKAKARGEAVTLPAVLAAPAGGE